METITFTDCSEIIFGEKGTSYIGNVANEVRSIEWKMLRDFPSMKQKDFYEAYKKINKTMVDARVKELQKTL